MTLNRTSGDTIDGTAVRIVPPFPTWPRSLPPQQNARPSATTRHEWTPPATTVTREVILLLLLEGVGAAGGVAGAGAGPATSLGVVCFGAGGGADFVAGVVALISVVADASESFFAFTCGCFSVATDWVTTRALESAEC
jgi:hypothetical protein